MRENGSTQLSPSSGREQFKTATKTQLSPSSEREWFNTVVSKERERTVQHSYLQAARENSPTQLVKVDVQEHAKQGMSTENNTGVQTRAMAQRVDNETNPEQLQRAIDPAMNPTAEFHRTKEDAIEEFVRQHGTINLDWYVPDLCNTRVGDLIKRRLQLETMEGRILFSSPALSKFFKTSNFELNLKTGEVFTYLDPPEDIGIKCQKEPFDLESLKDTLQGKQDTGTMQEERLERIPSVKKLVGPADVMPREEAEYKVRQYCHLWTMYTDSSVELKKKSELSQESAVAACKKYVPYISDITRQIAEVVKNICHRKRTKVYQKQRLFPSTTVGTRRMQDRNNPEQRGTNERNK